MLKHYKTIKRGSVGWICNNSLIRDDIKFEFLPSRNRWQNSVKEKISKLGLLNHKSWNKFIPDQYMKSSINERLELLRGLMDTDGTVKTNGEASFTTTSLVLANNVSELVNSLGGRAVIRSRNRIGKKSLVGDRAINSKRISYEFNISLPNNMNPFFLPRKKERFNCSFIFDDKIVSIEPVGMKEVQCIKVENKDSLYITDQYIVTHNTADEKMEPWIAPIKDNLRFLIGDGTKSKSTEETLNHLMEKGLIEVEIIAYIRGRSIPKAFMIIDEAQNLSGHELKTIITRCGEGTKIVLTGDIEQIDNLSVDATTNALTIAVEKFKDSPLAGHVTLVKGERSQLATEAAKIL